MIPKGVDPDTVEHASIDLSPAFIKRLRDSFPKAEVHFDRFHIKKLLNEAMDEVRRVARREHEELKGHKYTFLKNRNTLSTEKEDALAKLIILYPTLGEAYRLKTLFDEVWAIPSEEAAQLFLESWMDQVSEKKINSFMKFAKTVMAHKTGIINFVKTRITNSIVEGINSKIQLAKRRARGCRNTDNFINMIYFLCGKINFIYPLKTR
jgi:transposase